MYPPMDENAMLHAAKALVGSIDALVRVTQYVHPTYSTAYKSELMLMIFMAYNLPTIGKIVIGIDLCG